MRLSILVPAYNVEGWVTRCLDSIFNQDVPSVEVVVVDDGSSDATYRVIEEYARQHVNLRLFHKHNEGVGAARNYLLDKACGEFIWFVDSDDYIAEGALRHILSELNSTIDLLSVSYNGGVFTPFEGSATEYIQKGYINGYLWTKIIRRSVIEDAHIRFDPQRYSQEDWFFLMQVYPLLGNIKQITLQAYVYCDDNENSVMREAHAEHTRRNVADSRETICNFKRFIDSHRDQFYSRAYEQWMNFSAAGYLYSLFPIDYTMEEIKNDIKIFREKGVYPVGKTGRRKADLFLRLANHEKIYLLLVKLYRIFK
ncbi:MAG: glycosyltransferase family 2 protein [Segatella oris]|uniref:glycosyltransferase family 2 protein n=1 Tax=Segatella oris TaxID=28135 RepID=UPI003FA1ABCA